MKYSALITAILLGTLRNVQAAPVSAGPPPGGPKPMGMVALRFETNGIQTFNGVSTQVIENAFGTNSIGLPFTGTNTYDFYSAPLTTAISIANNENIAGIVYMTNAAPTAANDFSVSSSMLFYDYDPLTGIDTLLIETVQPAQHPVHPRKLEHWKLNRPPGPAHNSFNLPAGHQLHIAVAIILRSGDPGSFAQLVINGRPGASTAASFPKSISFPADWPTPLIVQVPSVLDSLTLMPDGSVVLMGEGDPEATYSIQATSSLGDNSSWTTIGSVDADIDGSIVFSDIDAINHLFRFYRLARH